MEDVKKLKKIDIHAHAVAFREYYPPLKPDKPDSIFVSAQQLIHMYDQLGIEKGVLLALPAVEGKPSPITSESCKYLSDKYPERLLWFCCVDPRAYPNKADCDLCRLLNHYKALGAKGVGEITSLVDMDDPKVENLFAACEVCDMPVIIHIASSYDDAYGLYDSLGLPRLEKMLQRHPNLKIIGHSQPFWSEISGDVTEELRGGYPTGKVTEGGRVVELMRKYPNLYCDYSAGSGCNAFTRDEEFTARFIEEFHDRVLFGCDICFPYNTQGFTLTAAIDRMLDEGKISKEHYRQLVRENAVKILKLEE